MASKKRAGNAGERPAVRYADDRPEDCRYCYYWSEEKKQCCLGKENCYYILPEKKVRKKSPCDDCPYAVVSPCIGYCMMELLGLKKKKEQDG